MMDEKIKQLSKQYDDIANLLGGCGDGGCVIVKPKGMHTNGGCHCVRNLVDDSINRGRLTRLIQTAQHLVKEINEQGESNV
jgi:hypothetical protein